MNGGLNIHKAALSNVGVILSIKEHCRFVMLSGTIKVAEYKLVLLCSAKIRIFSFSLAAKMLQQLHSSRIRLNVGLY